MSSEEFEDNLHAQKIKNDAVDEVIDLENPEEVNNEMKIKNQPVDEVHHLSSEDSENNHVPSPEESQDSKQANYLDMELANTAGESMMKSQVQKKAAFEGYNPKDYLNLNISQEVKQIFSLITDYQTEVYEIESILKPFIPDYIPAIGEVDGFLKIPRPDGDPEMLGLRTLDEPKLNQSKKAVIDLILAEHGKLNRREYKEVHSIENAHKNGKEITNWVNNVDKISKSKMAPTVVYRGKMPDVDTLMQV